MGVRHCQAKLDGPEILHVLPQGQVASGAGRKEAVFQQEAWKLRVQGLRPALHAFSGRLEGDMAFSSLFGDLYLASHNQRPP